MEESIYCAGSCCARIKPTNTPIDFAILRIYTEINENKTYHSRWQEQANNQKNLDYIKFRIDTLTLLQITDYDYCSHRRDQAIFFPLIHACYLAPCLD